MFGRGGEEAEALHRGRRAVRGRARDHERDRRARVRRHPGDAPRAVDAASRSSPATRTRPRAAPTPTGTRSRASGGTLVILMGAGRIAEIAKRADRRRPRRDTPVAAVRWGTRPDQRTVRATLGTIADGGRRGAERDRRRRRRRARLRLVRAPAAVRPHGRRDARARAGERAARAARGARRRRCSSCPRSRSSRSTFALPDLARLRTGSCSRRRTASTRSSTAASRPRASTRARSRRCGSRRSDRAPPTRSRAAGSAPTSCPSGSSPSRCSTRSRPAPGGVLLARAEAARDVLPEGLAAKGYDVDVLAVYRTVPAAPDRRRARASARGAVDAITFTSSSTVDNFCDAVGRAPGSAAARRLDRPGHGDDGARPGPARRRRGRSAHDRRPGRGPGPRLLGASSLSA